MQKCVIDEPVQISVHSLNRTIYYLIYVLHKMNKICLLEIMAPVSFQVMIKIIFQTCVLRLVT